MGHGFHGYVSHNHRVYINCKWDKRGIIISANITGMTRALQELQGVVGRRGIHHAGIQQGHLSCPDRKADCVRALRKRWA